MDYFFLTSELASLKEKPYITDVIIGTSQDANVYIKTIELPFVGIADLSFMAEGVEGYYFFFPVATRVTKENLYDLYAYNTIGSIEQTVKVDSSGQFDAIRPYFTNGVPDYRFVNSEYIQLTKQLSPLYSSIVVSSQHYQELLSMGYSKSEIIFDLNSVDLWSHTWNINSEERNKGAKQEIMISNKGFEYENIEIYIQAPSGRVDVTNYFIEDGTIYFTRLIRDILGNTILDFIVGENNYDLHLLFDTIIPFETSSHYEDGNQIPNNLIAESGGADGGYGNEQYYYQTIDTNDDTGRLALSQTLSYSISDYFNQYYIAATDANFRVNFEFTWITTLWSTLFSTLIMLPVAVGTAMLSSGNSLGGTVAAQLSRIPSAVVEEVWEELFLDPIIERYFYSRVQLAGGSEAFAEFISMLATSVREGLGGVGSYMATQHNINLGISFSQFFHLSEQYAGNAQHPTALNQLDIPIVSLIMTPIIAGFTGGFGALALGFTSIGLNFATDFASNMILYGLTVPSLDESTLNLMRVQQSLFSAASQLNTLNAIAASSNPALLMHQAIQTFQINPSTLVNFETQRSQAELSLSKLRLERDLFNLEIQNTLAQKQEILSQVQKATNLQKFSGIQDSDTGNLNGLFISGPNYGRVPAHVADPFLRFKNRLIWLDAINIDKSPMTVDQANEVFGRPFNMDSKKPKVSIIKGQIVASGLSVMNDNGDIMPILSDTLYTKVQEFLGYAYNSRDAWSDPSMQIEMIYREDITRTTRMATLEQSFSGFSKIRISSEYLFKNQFWSLFGNYKGAKALDMLYSTLIHPMKNAFLSEFDLMDGNEINIEKVKKQFKTFMFNRWNPSEIKSVMDDYGLTKGWDKFIEEMFDTYFASGFSEDLSVSYSKDSIREIIEKRVDSMIFDIFMRDYVKIDQAMTGVIDIVEKINDILYSGDILNVINDFNTNFLGKQSKTLTYFMETLSRGFFADETHNRMTSKFGATTFHGAILEAQVFFYELPTRVAELFKIYYSQESEFYKFIEYVDNDQPARLVADFNQKILQDSLGSKENLGELTKQLFGFEVKLNSPSKGRAPDLGVFDFIHLVLSNHLKNTWIPGGKTNNLREEIVIDTISAQIIDFYAQVWRNNDYIHKHVNDLYSPYTFEGNFETREASSIEIFRNLLSKTDFMQLVKKVNPEHVLLFEISKLINLNLENPPSYGFDPRIEAEFYINELFSNPDFITSIDIIIEDIYSDSKLRYIRKQGDIFLRNLKSIFNDNLDNLLIESPNGYKILWGASVSHLFSTDENGNAQPLTFDLLPQNVKYISNNQDGTATVSPLTAELLDSMLNNVLTSLFVAHDKEGNFIVVDNFLKNQLPEGVVQGYYHRGNDKYNGKTFDNVFLNVEGSHDLMFGRVRFDGAGKVSILSEDWYIAFMNDHHISYDVKKSTLHKAQMWSTDDKEKGVFSLDHYIVIGYTTGSRYVGSPQQTTTNLIPTKTFESYMPWTVTSSSEASINTINYKFPTAIELKKMYGKEFITEFNDIFTQLFDPYTLSYGSPVVSKVHNFLDKLNGYFKDSGFENFILGPNNLEINTIINELFRNQDGTFDEAGFQSFIWRNDDGTFRATFLYPDGTYGKFTSKMWLNDLYLRIKDYQGTNPSIKKARQTLQYFATKIDYADTLDVTSEKYTNKEANIAQKIFDVVQEIFGHFTVRLTFANMIDYYSNGENIGIKITKRPPFGVSSKSLSMGRMFSHIGFTTHTTFRGRVLTILARNTRARDLFGYFFLGASLRLSLETSGYKDIDLSFGPLLGAGSQENGLSLLTTTGTSSKTEVHKLSELLGEQFSSIYDVYYQSRDPFSEFVETQTNLFNALKVHLDNKINAIFKLKSVENEAEKLGVFIEEWRAYISSLALRSLRLGLLQNSYTEDSIRGQVDTFLSNEDPTFDLIFHGINNPNPKLGDLSLTLSKTDLLGIDFNTWATLGLMYSDTSLYTVKKREMIMNALGDKVQEMKAIIQTSGGKVFAIPFSPKGDTGFQYSYDKEWFYPANDYFEIDLSNPDSELILLHLAVSMLSTDSGFILTRADKSLIDGPKRVFGGNNYFKIREMICAFNRERFFRKTEFYSLNDNSEFQIIVDSEYGLDYTFKTSNWLRNWGSIFSFTGSKGGDFHWYKNLIKNNIEYRNLRILLLL